MGLEFCGSKIASMLPSELRRSTLLSWETIALAWRCSAVVSWLRRYSAYGRERCIEVSSPASPGTRMPMRS